jgi:hypothetical protein
MRGEPAWGPARGFEESHGTPCVLSPSLRRTIAVFRIRAFRERSGHEATDSLHRENHNEMCGEIRSAHQRPFSIMPLPERSGVVPGTDASDEGCNLEIFMCLGCAPRA